MCIVTSINIKISTTFCKHFLNCDNFSLINLILISRVNELSSFKSCISKIYWKYMSQFQNQPTAAFQKWNQPIYILISNLWLKQKSWLFIHVKICTQFLKKPVAKIIQSTYAIDNSNLKMWFEICIKIKIDSRKSHSLSAKKLRSY